MVAITSTRSSIYYLVLAERKGAGRIGRRAGPNEAGYAGWLQPVADGIKLLSKQVMIPPGSDRLLFWWPR